MVSLVNDRKRMLAKARQHIHQRLITTLDSDPLDLLDNVAIERRVQLLIDTVGSQAGVTFSDVEKQSLALGVVHEVSGLGPLQPLLDNPAISDILINGPDSVWVDQNGRLERSGVHFDDEAHLRRFVDRFVGSHGKHLDSTNPAVDTRLPDGSRLHAVIPPLSPVGTVVSIRKFRHAHTSLSQLVSSGMLSESMAQTLELAIKARVNVVFSGGAGAGKTTLLNAVSEFIPSSERIVTIEDSAELALRHQHVIALESRQENSEGRGKYDLRALLRHALRMRADRIIVGEVRGDEVFDMLQAMNIGHDGSLTTIHANDPRQALKRIETLAMLSDVQAPREAVRDMVDTAVGLIVHVGKDVNGVRRVLNIVELVLNGDDRELRDLFGWNPEGVRCFARPAFLAQPRCQGLRIPQPLADQWSQLE
jgi:pilus assembly protein CpaF